MSFFTDCPDEERLAALRFSHPNSSGQEYALVPGKNPCVGTSLCFLLSIFLCCGSGSGRIGIILADPEPYPF
jgi:hypothetical protein